MDPLTPEQRIEFEKLRTKLQILFQPQMDALVESRKIRAEDLAVTINSQYTREKFET